VANQVLFWNGEKMINNKIRMFLLFLVLTLTASQSIAAAANADNLPSSLSDLS